MEMIDKLAGTIYTQAFEGDEEPPPWEEIVRERFEDAPSLDVVETYHTALGIARAVLESMREPTEEMEKAFMDTLSWFPDTTLGRQQKEAWRKENIRRWQLMIDAALGKMVARAGR